MSDEHSVSKQDQAVLSSSISWGRLRTGGILTTSILIMYGSLLLLCAYFTSGDAVRCFLFMNFKGTVGIPAAIIASLGIVALLSSSVGGEFKIKIWGLHLEGPSAPITMWVVCFLAMALTVNVLLPAQVTYEELAPVIRAFCEGCGNNG